VPAGQVRIDGGPALALPLVSGVSLRPGAHSLRFTGPGGLVGSTTTEVLSGETRVLCWDLRADQVCAR